MATRPNIDRSFMSLSEDATITSLQFKFIPKVYKQCAKQHMLGLELVYATGKRICGASRMTGGRSSFGHVTDVKSRQPQAPREETFVFATVERNHGTQIEVACVILLQAKEQNRATLKGCD